MTRTELESTVRAVPLARNFIRVCGDTGFLSTALVTVERWSRRAALAL